MADREAVQRKDTEFQAFVLSILECSVFKIIMISTISTNAFFVVLWTNYEIRFSLFRLFEISEVLFVSIYSLELILKLYVNPIDYWKDGYNLLDVVIIIIIIIPYALQKIKGKHYPYLNIANGMQSLRILKLITYSRGIRTLIIAVGHTAYTVASVLILLFLLMYIFAVLGFCLFGTTESGDLNNWGNLGVAFFTLFSLATVDGWTDLQEELDNRNFVMSRTFTIVFILLASFVFLSMFVGVMIIHTEDSIRKFERELKLERHMLLMEERQVILRRQKEEVNRLMQTQQNVDYNSFSELVDNFKKTLQHTDPMVLDDFGTSIPFIDIYLSTLDNQDSTIYKLQELYYEIVHVLNLALEDLPKKKQSQSLEAAET
ncbi:PREDICTED: cation channel sperm-associated protein 3 [Chrysochloris asiatica]|uniref:Cation channel sperm-associated protein 3 n=1 Tax=Chrysochloris asiatica TaxID=185453 RepID=A0A9B0TLF1_CHRAS|nr:PREDICTED: cation channel sperm-associated protein 3 [Chrysochloris asiatica]